MVTGFLPFDIVNISFSSLQLPFQTAKFCFFDVEFRILRQLIE